MPVGISAQDVQVSGGADSLIIRPPVAPADDADAAPLLSVRQLYSTVSPADTRIESPAQGRLRVILRKLDSNIHWPGLEATDGPAVRPPNRDAASSMI